MIRNNPFDRAPIITSPEKKLTPEELREKFRIPTYLPTHDEILRAFCPDGYSLSDTKREWDRFCRDDEENPFFEVLNEEFIDAFTDYLVTRAESFDVTEGQPVTILEVGAGNGRLSYFLQKKLEEKFPGKIRVVATDSGEWELKQVFPVEVIGHDDALKKYQPKIVIFSWMPPFEDYSADFRKMDSVEEYLLIGEADDDMSGDAWLTWGIDPTAYKKKPEDRAIPPYEVDGFERENLVDISKKQICRTDFPGEYFHSKTVSFKRKE